MGYIIGGSRLAYQGMPLLIQARAWDPNTLLPYNTPDVQVNWTCWNPVNSSLCYQTDGNELNTTLGGFSLFVDQNALALHTTYNISLTVYKGRR